MVLNMVQVRVISVSGVIIVVHVVVMLFTSDGNLTIDELEQRMRTTREVGGTIALDSSGLLRPHVNVVGRQIVHDLGRRHQQIDDIA